MNAFIKLFFYKNFNIIKKITRKGSVTETSLAMIMGRFGDLSGFYADFRNKHESSVGIVGMPR